MIDHIGSRTHGNILARPIVGLVWSPLSETDYSLIVDCQAAISVRITPIRAVLHPPASSPKPTETTSCGSDCIEISLASSPDKLKLALAVLLNQSHVDQLRLECLTRFEEGL